MSAELIHALEQLEKEKGIKKEFLIDAIEAALMSAYKKNFGPSQNVRINIDRDTGEVKVFALKRVTSDPENDTSDISLEAAKKINSRAEEEDTIELLKKARNIFQIK